MAGTLEIIRDWATGLDYWERAALERIASGATPTENDLSQLLIWFMQDCGLIPMPSDARPGLSFPRCGHGYWRRCEGIIIRTRAAGLNDHHLVLDETRASVDLDSRLPPASARPFGSVLPPHLPACRLTARPGCGDPLSRLRNYRKQHLDCPSG
jgi:hypothetical protein